MPREYVNMIETVCCCSYTFASASTSTPHAGVHVIDCDRCEGVILSCGKLNSVADDAIIRGMMK